MPRRPQRTTMLSTSLTHFTSGVTSISDEGPHLHFSMTHAVMYVHLLCSAAKPFLLPFTVSNFSCTAVRVFNTGWIIGSSSPRSAMSESASTVAEPICTASLAASAGASRVSIRTQNPDRGLFLTSLLAVVVVWRRRIGHLFGCILSLLLVRHPTAGASEGRGHKYWGLVGYTGV